MVPSPIGEQNPTTPDSVEWWKIPRYPRPAPEGDNAEIQRIATALRSEVLKSASRLSRAVAHAIWAAACWARREAGKDGRLRLQMTLSYIQTGASVGRRAAEMALDVFKKWTRATVLSGGWMVLAPAALSACWEALDFLWERELMEPPQIEPSLLVPAFSLEIPGDRERGKTRCGCPDHARGDQDPSLLFDLERGFATCMVSHQTYILQRENDGWIAHRIERGIKQEEPTDLVTITNNTPSPSPPSPVPPARSDGNSVECGGNSVIFLPGLRALELAGQPGICPWRSGIAMGRLWPAGLSCSISESSDRSSWARWQESRWGGANGEEIAYQAVAYGETGAPCRGWMPERLVGVGWWRVQDVFWIEGRSGRWPQLQLEERGTGHTLLDIDRIPGLPREPIPELVEEIREILEGQGILGSVAWVLRTSRTGLQVLVELQRFRWDPTDFYREQAVQRFLRSLGSRVAALLGGEMDPSSLAPRRFGRAPGWRVKAGEPELAKLWYIADL